MMSGGTWYTRCYCQYHQQCVKRALNTIPTSIPIHIIKWEYSIMGWYTATQWEFKNLPHVQCDKALFYISENLPLPFKMLLLQIIHRFGNLISNLMGNIFVKFAIHIHHIDIWKKSVSETGRFDSDIRVIHIQIHDKIQWKAFLL